MFMAKRIAVSTLNATTLDILNTIRANASAEYQNIVPEVKQSTDIPKVGEVLYGYPAMANQFLTALVNRIALVRVNSATFNNAFARLKKGYLAFGETVEEVFVNIAKAREFSVEKAEARELKRSLPDVRSAFHTMNWRVQYPVTIQDEDLRMAFTNEAGVQDLIAKIVDSVYTAAEYDEFLLFKYLIIKAVSHGKMFPVGFDGTDMKTAAKTFRGISNLLPIMSTKYNVSGVHTATPRSQQIIFMDAMFNAAYDVDVLASAFNMDKATFMGSLFIVDSFTEFDNDRFNVIRENSTMLEAVTEDELTLMKGVKAVTIDEEWFQVYDNQNKFTEKYVASGEYWNYFYNVWKTVSFSPFSNAVAYIDTTVGSISEPESLTINVETVSDNGEQVTVTLVPDEKTASLTGGQVRFLQTKEATQAGVAVHPYGAVLFGKEDTTGIKLEATVGGVKYDSDTTKVSTGTVAGEQITMNKTVS